MPDNQGISICEATAKYGGASNDYLIQGRGRPERKPREAAKRILRRRAFGLRLREMRFAANLTLSHAAELSGMASPRKLSQYETTCYPPGDIVRILAPIYGVCERELAEMVLSHSDPDLFLAITGRPGFEVSEAMIADYLINPGQDAAPAKPVGDTE